MTNNTSGIETFAERVEVERQESDRTRSSYGVTIEVRWTERHGWWDDWAATIYEVCPECGHEKERATLYRHANEVVGLSKPEVDS